jgi:hypothetical protein
MDEYMCAMVGSSPPEPDIVPAVLAEARLAATGKRKEPLQGAGRAILRRRQGGGEGKTDDDGMTRGTAIAGTSKQGTRMLTDCDSRKHQKISQTILKIIKTAAARQENARRAQHSGAGASRPTRAPAGQTPSLDMFSHHEGGSVASGSRKR